jgi:hypothetical protein
MVDHGRVAVNTRIDTGSKAMLGMLNDGDQLMGEFFNHQGDAEQGGGRPGFISTEKGALEAQAGYLYPLSFQYGRGEHTVQATGHHHQGGNLLFGCHRALIEKATPLGNTNPEANLYLAGGDSLETQAFLAAGMAGEEGDLTLGEAERFGKEFNQGLVGFAIHRRSFEPDFQGIAMQALYLGF